MYMYMFHGIHVCVVMTIHMCMYAHTIMLTYVCQEISKLEIGISKLKWPFQATIVSLLYICHRIRYSVCAHDMNEQWASVGTHTIMHTNEK